MKLLASFIIAAFFSMLIFMGPLGIYVVVVCLLAVIFRSYFLLVDIHKQVVPIDANDQVKDAYERYMIEREEKEKNNN